MSSLSSSSSFLGIADYVVIVLMLLVSAGIGLYFRFTGGRQKTTTEFFLANRNMSPGPVAFSLMATYLSAVAILGIPAEGYMYGTQYIMLCAALPFAGLVAAYGFVPVFFNMQLTTSYEYLERRYGKTTRTVGSAFFTLQMVFHMTLALYAPSLALNAVTGLSTWVSVISLAAVCTFYCTLGGLKAVLWTDVFQASLMYITVLAIFIKAIINFGSIGELFNIANDGERLRFFNMSPSPFERYTFWNSFSAGVIFVLSSYGTHQATIQRMLSVRQLKKAQNALFWSLFLICVYIVLCHCVGISIYATFHDCDPMQQPGKKLTSPDQLVPYTVLKMFSSIPGLAGLCIAGIFSAALSTVSSALNSVTVVVMEDFIRPFCFCKKLTESWAAFLAKIIALCIGSLCLLLTYFVSSFKGVLEATNITSGMVRGPILGIYILGMFTKTANEPGMLIGLIVGFAVNAWIALGYYVNKVKIPTLPRSTAGCAAVANVTSYSTTSPLQTTLSLESLKDGLNLTGGEEKYVFPLYRMSFLVFPVIGMTVVVLVGYLASLIVGIWKKYPVVDSNCISPFVRKWYFGDTPVTSKSTINPVVGHKLKSSSGVNNFNIGSCTTVTSET